MWSATLRPSPVRWFRTPSRALSSSLSRGRARPRGPRNSIQRPERIPSARGEGAQPQPQPSQPPQPESSHPETSHPNTANYDPSRNTLLAPVHIPEDPNAVLRESHPAVGLLANSGLVVQRQLELMNVMIGFEQANKYVILDASGNHVGYMAELEKGMGNMMARQWFGTHRAFVTHVFDRHENEVLRFHRPFSYINSRMRIYDPLSIAKGAYSSSTALQSTSTESLVQASGDSNARISSLGVDDMRVIGEVQQQWAPLRRKYNLFNYHHSPNPEIEMGTERLPFSNSGMSKAQQMQLTRSGDSSQEQGEFHQFAYVDEPFLSWDFGLRSADNQLIGSVNRDFAGFAREIFTDTGVYALRMDSASLNPEAPQDTRNNPATGMSLDQRAVMLATAVNVDYDYFSRHSGSGGGFGFMPIWIPGMGGDAAAGGVAAGEAGAVGETAAGAAGRAGAAGGMAEGVGAGATGAGAMAGYDAMQRGMGGEPNAQSPTPDQSPPPYPMDQQQPPPGQPGPYGDFWAEEPPEDPWGHDDQDPWSGGDGGDDGGGDGFDWF